MDFPPDMYMFTLLNDYIPYGEWVGVPNTSQPFVLSLCIWNVPKMSLTDVHFDFRGLRVR